MINQAVFGRTRVITFSAALLALAIGLAFALASDTALAQSNAPATPSSVALTRADGTVTASWPAVSGATKYHVTYSSDNKASWTAAASPGDNHSANSITFNADNGKSYVVGVRAGNDGGQWSGWRNSPSVGPYTPPDPTPTPTPTPAPAPPAAPASVTVTRADGTVTASWNAPDGATKYHVTYSSDNKQSWTAASDNHTGNSITITGADNSKTYVVGVRAGNAGGWSGWTNSDAAAPLPAAPANFTVTNGDGFFDLAWDAVTDATGYDVRAKINNSASWSSVATGVTTNSYRYTTSSVVNKLAVRATNGNGNSAWSELSRGPNDAWLTTVQQSGASAQSVQGQSQLAAPASITVTRENNSRDEKLYVTWAAVSGASGYNLACASHPPSNTPYSSVSWWHCGAITSGSTTSFTVDRDQVADLVWNRPYTVAVRAVTTTPAEASPWALATDVNPAYNPDGDTISTSREAGSISLSWERQIFSQGYQIECATRENNVTGAYTLCADVSSATAVNGRYSATISSWTAGGTNYTIDDTKTYDLAVRHTNAWGNSPWVLAPLIHPNPALTVSSVGVTAATLTIANHSGNWYYQADTSPDNTCQGPVSGSSKALTSLSPHTRYSYGAYSDSTCTTANLLATATPFTTLFASVSNLTSTKHATIESFVSSTQDQAVAFTTGANAGGYILKSVTVPLKDTGGTNGVAFDLRAMQGTGQYSSTSQPSETILAILSTATPTASTYTDTTVTCSGSGCSLSPNTTYFISARTTDDHPAYSWAVSTSETETAQPSGNGWSVRFGHYKNDNALDWGSWSDWNIAEITFETVTTLTPSNLTATGATLTIAGYPGANWYYKYTSPSGGACSSAVSGASATVTMSGGSYTFAAYSDASCSNLLATTIAFSKDTKPAAPSSVTAVDTAEKHLSSSWQQPLLATKYHVTYTCNNGNDWGSVAYGTVDSQANLSQTGQTVTATVNLSGGWWNNQTPACRMGVRAGNDNGWSTWAESNSVTPP